MAAAAIWLEELGIPPRDICLDWAWQIQSQFADLPQAVREDTTPLRWQLIEVGETGELVLPGDLRGYSPQGVLQELLVWSRGESLRTSSPANSAICRTNFESELRRQTIDTREIAPSSEAEVSQFAVWPKVSHTKANFARVAMPSHSNHWQQLIVALKRHPFAASLVSVMLIACCCFTLSAGPGKIKSAKPAESAHDPFLAASQKRPHQTDETATHNAAELENSESIETLAELPQFGVLESEVRDAPQVAMPSVSVANLTGLAGSKTTGVSAEVIPNDSMLSGTDETREATTKNAISDRDVMKEVETIAISATNNPLEVEIAIPEAGESSTIAEPLVLRTSPMIQTQKLAAQIKLRPRQAVWQIVFSVDDEFKLTPNEPQSVTDRQVTTWFLSDSNSKTPQVRIVIQAQAAPSRQLALRWRIFAGAEDIPNLMLPLDKEVLQPLQDRLRIYSQVAERESDRLKQLASGAEKEIRTAMLQQRTNLESQRKLAGRLSTIVAEAQLLDDLLRRQLTLYAKLRDGDGPAAPTLLQFGDPAEQQKFDEASDPPENAG